MSAQQYYNSQQQPSQDYQPPYNPQYNNAYPQGPPPPQGQNNGNWGMKPPQSYAPPPNPPPPGNGEYGGNPYGDTAPFSQATEKTGERFKPRKRLNDPIFLILFIANLAGFAVLSGIAIKSFIDVNGLGGGFGDATQGGTGSSITLD